MKYITTIDNKEFEIEVVDERHIRIGERLLEVDFESVSGQPVFSLILDGKSYESFVYQGEDDWEVLIRGQQYQSKLRMNGRSVSKPRQAQVWLKEASSISRLRCPGWLSQS